MDPDLLGQIESRAAAYRAVQDRAGISLRCLDPDADDVPPVADLSTDGGAATVRIQGPLDFWYGFDYQQLISQLDEASPSSIHLLVESPGGFLSDGLALWSDLRARSRAGVKVTAEARGMVASAAVLPFLAADDRAMPSGTQLMVHNPWSLVLALGTADEIEDGVGKSLTALRAGEKALRDVMAERTGKSRQQVAAWLKAETWFDPEGAVEAGFATTTIEDTATADGKRDEQARALARRVMVEWRLKHTGRAA